MWMNFPGKNSRRRATAVGLLLGLLLAPTHGMTQANPSDRPQNKSIQFTLTGKLACSLKQPVILPFQALITSLTVQPGQRVAQGEVLARYRLTPEAVWQIRQRLVASHIKELEARQAGLQRKRGELESKVKTLKKLAQENLASRQSLAQVERELQNLSQEQKAVQDRLQGERQLHQDYLALLNKQLGVPVNSSRLPVEGVLKAPLGGQVIWLHPELREGAELKAMEPVFQVGVMDPMIIRAQVHEMEAVHLSLGSRGDLTLETLPERKFAAAVSRLSWTPLSAAPDQPSYYEVEFTVANTDLSLREGLKGRIVVGAAR